MVTSDKGADRAVLKRGRPVVDHGVWQVTSASFPFPSLQKALSKVARSTLAPMKHVAGAGPHAGPPPLSPVLTVLAQETSTGIEFLKYTSQT
jgi:hypothetical protein